jgi:C4-dicarboxylate transporter, DctM subunit
MMLLAAATLLVLFIAASLHVAGALGLLAATLASNFSTLPLLRGLGEMAWGTSSDFILIAVPMFILMGELLLRSGMAESMIDALDAWVGRLPGGLMHTNIAACALFAATSGSSIATAATVGTVSIPSMQRLGYPAPLFLGSIAAGGTLGILIPPSINMVLYGALSETSVSDLYAAALLPGLLMALLFSLVIVCISWWRPSHRLASEPASWAVRRKGLVALLPPLALFGLVVVSIYLGLATPTEAAALGVVGTLVLVGARGRLNAATLWPALEGTMRTTSMVMLIVLAAFFLNFVIQTIGLADAVVKAVETLAWPPLVVLLVIIAAYLVLGCFVETLTLMVATTPIVVPVIVKLGYDPVWFGVVFVILIEAALITPPIGMNLFVVQSIRGRGPIADVALGALPFLAMMLLMIGLLIAWPGLAMTLPAWLQAARP